MLFAPGVTYVTRVHAAPTPCFDSEKRAKAERASRLRAMAARYERGLLSKREEVTFAELCAQDPDLVRSLSLSRPSVTGTAGPRTREN